MTGDISLTQRVWTVNHKVSDSFYFVDFVCSCCDRIKIIPAFFTHVGLLEQLQHEAGFSIKVIKGYECREQNKATGGHPRSWHLLFATDVIPAELNDGHSRNIIRMIAEDIGFQGIGLCETHVHLDMRPDKVVWRA